MKQPIIIEVPEGWEIDETAIQKVALKKKNPTVYPYGTRVYSKSSKSEYLLCRSDLSKAIFVNLKDGNRWAASAHVNGSFLTEAEFSAVANRPDWRDEFTITHTPS